MQMNNAVGRTATASMGAFVDTHDRSRKVRLFVTALDKRLSPSKATYGRFFASSRQSALFPMCVCRDRAWRRRKSPGLSSFRLCVGAALKNQRCDSQDAGDRGSTCSAHQLDQVRRDRLLVRSGRRAHFCGPLQMAPLRVSHSHFFMVTLMAGRRRSFNPRL